MIPQRSKAFVCPHCKVYAQHDWFELFSHEIDPDNSAQVLLTSLAQGPRAKAPTFNGEFAQERMTFGTQNKLKNLELSACTVCKKGCVWIAKKVAYPTTSTAPPPNPDMPEAVRADYEEAAKVLPHSPRASAALLRLATERLLAHLLGRERAKLNTMIGDLITAGVPLATRQAMDVLRVTGNDAVHPEALTDFDTPATAAALFGLVNLICEEMITRPKHVAALFNQLDPEEVRKIEERDARNAKKIEKVSRETSTPDQARKYPPPSDQ